MAKQEGIVTAGLHDLVTRRELAERLDVHMMTVTKWERDGLPIAQRGRKGKPSLYSEVEVRAWLQARDEAAETAGVFDAAMERARKEHWQACLAEQLHAMRAKTLLSAEEVEKAWASEIGAARAVILTSYTAAADRVYRAGTTDGLAGVERELKAIAYSILRELSEPTSKGRKPAA